MSVFQRLSGRLRRFGRCERGNVALLFALTAVPLFGVAGIAMDYARASADRTRLQNVLDGAVLAGAAASGKEVATAQAFFDAAIADAGLTEPTAQFNVTDSGLTGTATGSLPSSLLGVLNIQKIDVGVQAAARKKQTASAVCILVLDPTSGQALTVNSGAKITAPDCEMHVRSTGNPGAMFNSGTTLDLKRICVKATKPTQNGGPYKVVEPNCAAISDPFAGKMPAAPTGLPNCLKANENFDSKSSFTFSSCVLANINVNGSGKTINLLPGTYIIRNTVNIGSGNTLTGQGVTLFFEQGSDLRFNSNVTLNLSAPTSGAYKGILIYENSTSTASWVVNGTAGYKLEGLIYLPKRNVTINSTSNVTADKMSLVVNTLILNNTNWKFAPNPDMPMNATGGTGSGAIISLTQ